VEKSSEKCRWQTSAIFTSSCFIISSLPRHLLTLHVRLLTADNARTPLFPIFLNSPFHPISLFLIHSAQSSPPPNHWMFSLQLLFRVCLISFFISTQPGFCLFLSTETVLTSMRPKARLCVHYHPAPKQLLTRAAP